MASACCRQAPSINESRAVEAGLSRTSEAWPPLGVQKSGRGAQTHTARMLKTAEATELETEWCERGGQTRKASTIFQTGFPTSTRLVPIGIRAMGCVVMSNVASPLSCSSFARCGA